MTPQECVIKLIEELVGTLPDMYVYDSYKSYIVPECYKIIIKSKSKAQKLTGVIIWIYNNEIGIRRHNELSSNDPCPKIEFCDPNLIEKITYELIHNCH